MVLRKNFYSITSISDTQMKGMLGRAKINELLLCRNSLVSRIKRLNCFIFGSIKIILPVKEFILPVGSFGCCVTIPMVRKLWNQPFFPYISLFKLNVLSNYGFEFKILIEGLTRVEDASIGKHLLLILASKSWPPRTSWKLLPKLIHLVHRNGVSRYLKFYFDHDGHLQQAYT